MQLLRSSRPSFAAVIAVIAIITMFAASCWSSSSSPPAPTSPPTSPPMTPPMTPTTHTEPSTSATSASPPAPPASPSKLAVTAIDPPKGDTQGGTFVRLQGNGFINDGPRNVKVYFGSRQGTIIRFQSDTELIVQAPGGKPNEVVDVLVMFDPGGQLKLVGAFTFVDKTP